MSDVSRPGEATPRIVLAPLEDTSTFADRAYTALKGTIVTLNVYEQPGEVRLDERQLASDLGISRTPVREAMAQLEREGFVRSVPRRGIYVVRKSKQEVIEMITAWAALESMAARLITTNATSEEVATLRKMFSTFENGQARAHLDEYSEVNIEFHQTIIRMSKNRVLIDLAENLFTHMRMIRRKTIGEQDRVDRSIRDHMNIIEALEARDDRTRRGPGARPRARPRRPRGEIRRLSGLTRMPHFFCRLIAPRPTFPWDMSDEEKVLMGRHAEYWKDMCDQGVVLVYGPVLDPKGPFGMGVFEGADEADIRRHTDADPVMQANIGFKIELIPMRAHLRAMAA